MLHLMNSLRLISFIKLPFIKKKQEYLRITFLNMSTHGGHSFKTNVRHLSRENAFARHLRSTYGSLYECVCSVLHENVLQEAVQTLLTSQRSRVVQVCPHRGLPTSDQGADGTDVERGEQDETSLGGLGWYTPTISYPDTHIYLIN